MNIGNYFNLELSGPSIQRAKKFSRPADSFRFLSAHVLRSIEELWPTESSSLENSSMFASDLLIIHDYQTVSKNYIE